MQPFPRGKSGHGVKVTTSPPSPSVSMFCTGMTLDLLYCMRATFPAKFTLLRLKTLLMILLLNCKNTLEF